ncbi:tautomerase enzyme family protein [Ralstonia insidiosa]|uniref:Tautomerase enzyme family protein n=1 Tax=Ralstonia insidiosa TaxID=190721 RepID=A0AAC9FU95_9RALS|nr:MULTISPECIES: 4-oxalocrotonate tautomerase family protein [Ralstonia]ANH76689.1 tautomerase enzyme family protein [Ralstonia insidiosa]EPX99380.1 4-oxalocrotonate tautomerase [Ralstonia sp. AU12-08]MBY4707117.1 4-oxalocrotonate tautomerase family protein [Ralstonia insidiosa]GAQ29121.1 4-oxalocrotonate tautomerase [Ralstonia sp. NT80]
MPILNVKVSAQRSAEMTQKISTTLLELTSRILGKDPKVTAIAIDYVDPADWIVGGQTLAAQGRHSVYFDIKVTDETNTKAEKAQYIAEAFEAFAALLGNLHEESYIYVQDVRAATYGYGGKTQEYRFQHA